MCNNLISTELHVTVPVFSVIVFAQKFLEKATMPFVTTPKIDNMCSKYDPKQKSYSQWPFFYCLISHGLSLVTFDKNDAGDGRGSSKVGKQNMYISQLRNRVLQCFHLLIC